MGSTRNVIINPLDLHGIVSELGFQMIPHTSGLVSQLSLVTHDKG